MNDQVLGGDSGEELVWYDKLADIVQKHLKIALYTARDVKRIHKKNMGAEVVRKLRLLSQETKDPGLRIGIVVIIRNITKDSILARELYKQKLDDFVFKCLDFPPSIYGNTDLCKCAILTIQEMASQSPEIEYCHSLALKGTAKFTRMIPDYVGEGEWHPQMLASVLATIQIYLVQLCSYRQLKGCPIPPADLRALKLRDLANTLLGVLKIEDRELPLEWSTVDMVTDCLTWIAYLQSSAILSLPSNKGVLLFVALCSSPSLILRARGFLGLVNLRHPDCAVYGRVGRFCDPHWPKSQGIEDFIPGLAEVEPLEDLPHLMAELFGEGIANDGASEPPCTTFFARGKVCDAFEPAMRLVKLELDGPSEEDESYESLHKKFFGSVKIDSAIRGAMLASLKAQERYYEADVLQLSILMHQIDDLKRTGRTPEFAHKLYVLSRVLARNGIQRWPDMPYFSYAITRSQTGAEYTDDMSRCMSNTSSSRYLVDLAIFEGILNFSGIGLAKICLYEAPDSYRLAGMDHVKSARKLCIAAPTGGMHLGPMHQKICVILRFITNQLLENPSWDYNARDSWLYEAREALATLQDDRYATHPEIRTAITDVIVHHKKAQKRWGLLVDELGKFEEVIADAKTFNCAPSEVEDETESLEVAPEAGDPKPDQTTVSSTDLKDNLSAKTDIYQAKLPRCSWCRKPSMGLKKCANCGNVRYCNQTCQRNHWRGKHRKECVSPEIAV
ncbi:hypothetical protein SISNIDRAFT_452069 [Sistotremastrum niveocremeum HHB9708]|uniref:MYND-type domain-containing protein n=1 Tax=Sistotremastrum niveocremeum HHB9708 TaxID=1314777 RepID=A0A164WXP6_9AGAM|nr:hypothetical protein SISNIDRAFT_452069 [Sistotremastrum niveocremeum HHB9708]